MKQSAFVGDHNMKKTLFLIPLLALLALSSCDKKQNSSSPQSETTSSENDSSSSSSSSSSSASGSSFSHSYYSEEEDPESDYYGGYYTSINKSWTGNTLLNALNALIDNSSVKVSYDWSRFTQADEDMENTKNVLLIYSRISMPKTQQDSGSNTYCWNREHTFPQSKMSSSKADKDNHIIFASEKTVNGKRGNKKMGVVTSGTVVQDFNGVATTCLYSGNIFDPHNRARAMVARSTMYAAAMYGYDVLDNFESVETMLAWNEEFAVDDFDRKRNDVVHTNQKNRNPFVDHPEFGCKIWGNTNAQTKSICGLE